MPHSAQKLSQSPSTPADADAGAFELVGTEALASAVDLATATGAFSAGRLSSCADDEGLVFTEDPLS
jgi:hypothetical protein